MKKQVFMGAVALLMLVGCAKEARVESPPQEKPQLTADEIKFLASEDGNTKFDQENIDRIIADAASFLGDAAPTRSGAQRAVASIEPLKISLPTTRTGETEEEDMFYVVNFADDEGYSVIAADERIEDEIALFVGSGNLDVENVENPGLEIALSRLDDYAAASIARHDAWRDSVRTALFARLEVENPSLLAQIKECLANQETTTRAVGGDPSFSTIEKIEGAWISNTATDVLPMIPVEWGQRGAFSVRAEAEKGAGTAAGCAGIVAVQLMAKWRHPTSYHGLNLSSAMWDEIDDWSGTGWDRPGRYKNWSGPMSGAPANIRQTVADLIWYVGEDLGMNWGSQSKASSQAVADLLWNCGYSVSLRQSFSSATVSTSLQANKPVFMSGSSTAGAHGWLVDGHLEQTKTDTFITTIWEIVNGRQKPVSSYVEERVSNRKLLHNNWGWDGDDDGYYVAGLFDPINDPDAPSNTTRNYNFNSSLGMWIISK